MLRRRGISVACTQTTRALLGLGDPCHELLVRVTNGGSYDTSDAGRVVAVGKAVHRSGGGARKQLDETDSGEDSVTWWRPVASGLMLLVALADMSAQSSRPDLLNGLRFSFDTVDITPNWRGALTRLAGTVEFAAGRGRLTVTAVRPGPPMAVNGVAIGSPLAAPGDYYLFDTTEFVLVRPSHRTFMRFSLTRADYNQTGRLLPGAFLMRYTPCSTDTLAVERVTQHAPISIHWHLDSLDERGPVRLYARGWLEIADAPAIEAGVARWFGVATALANRPNGIGALARTNLQLTAVALLRTSEAREPYLRYSALLRPLGLAAVKIDPMRLLLPGGYTETAWLNGGRTSSSRLPRDGSAAKWRRLPGAHAP